MPNPFAPAESYVAVGPEATRGTAVSSFPATAWLPVRSPDWTQNTKFLEDKGYRGSMVDTYGWVEGVKYGEYSFQGDVFPDTIGHLLRGIQGSFDVMVGVVTGSTQTTTASTVVGATSISVGTSIPVSTIIQIGTGALSEIRTVGVVSGAGPYSLSFATPLKFAHASSTSVSIVTSTQFQHRQSVLNNDPTNGNQPPSYTFVDFYGPEARQFANCMFSEVTFSSSVDSLLSYTAKALGNPPTAVGAPTSAFTTTAPIPGWTCAALLNGLDGKVMSHEVSFKRSVTPKFTQTGTQSPYRMFAGPLSVSGKVTVLMESTTELALFLSNTQPTVDFLYTVSADAALEFHMQQVAFNQPPKINRGADAVEVDLSFDCVPNTTDAMAGGLSPCRTYLTNLLSSFY